MPIAWRPVVRTDIARYFSLGPAGPGDFAVSGEFVEFLNCVVEHPFFFSALVESETPIQGHHLIGVGLAIIVSPEFAAAEIASPRPNVLSRILDGVRASRPVFASWPEVARANSGHGVDIVTPYCGWRDEILNDAQRREVQTLFVSSLAANLEGFRIHSILTETESVPVTDFHRRSIEYSVLAEFPEFGRTLHLMTRETATLSPGSIGNVIFRRVEPVLVLRPSHQQLLIAALKGATDSELAACLGITPTAVKARWRSIYARLGGTMPGLELEAEWGSGRGAQKRHRALAYLRNHPEELRPYDRSASY